MLLNQDENPWSSGTIILEGMINIGTFGVLCCREQMVFLDKRLKNSVVLYTNPMNAPIEQQDPKYQIQLCELQADPVFQSRNEVGPEIFKLLDRDRFPNLRSLGLKITSMFGSSYMYV
ncbi:uncharacterized protein LOC113472370 [Diaphorina citri]|uniref:Uncharacterized protein LOC113472370 n=1 Tax=Diaphorina citri TaxID=121845 RepID=A0A3Q0JM41_DIACI|nr:uncharacterized protein LOC113472370 [Diaphorina citri]